MSADNKITIDLENLTNEEREFLLGFLAGFAEKKKASNEWQKDTIFDINENIKYWCIDDGGQVAKVGYDYNASSRKKFGNRCTGYTYMQEQAIRIKLLNWISAFAQVINKEWKPNWNDSKQCKYFIMYDYEENKYLVNYDINSRFCFPNEIYFKSREAAQRCIDEILIPLDKGGTIDENYQNKLHTYTEL